MGSLNRLLADEHVLYTKTRNYHWNVVGPRFHSLHEFFEEVYEQLAETIDETAENVRQFGGFACGTMKEFLQFARISEQPGRIRALLDGQGGSIDLTEIPGTQVEFDRFGIITTWIDGNAQRVYFDDLTYTMTQ